MEDIELVSMVTMRGCQVSTDKEIIRNENKTFMNENKF